MASAHNSFRKWIVRHTWNETTPFEEGYGALRRKWWSNCGQSTISRLNKYASRKKVKNVDIRISLRKAETLTGFSNEEKVHMVFLLNQPVSDKFEAMLREDGFQVELLHPGRCIKVVRRGTFERVRVIEPPQQDDNVGNVQQVEGAEIADMDDHDAPREDNRPEDMELDLLDFDHRIARSPSPLLQDPIPNDDEEQEQNEMNVLDQERMEEVQVGGGQPGNVEERTGQERELELVEGRAEDDDRQNPMLLAGENQVPNSNRFQGPKFTKYRKKDHRVVRRALPQMSPNIAGQGHIVREAFAVYGEDFEIMHAENRYPETSILAMVFYMKVGKENLVGNKKHSVVHPRFMEAYEDDLYEALDNLNSYILFEQKEEANFIMPLIRDENESLLYFDMEKSIIYYADPLFRFDFEDYEIMYFAVELGMRGWRYRGYRTPRIVKLKHPNLRQSVMRIKWLFPMWMCSIFCEPGEFVERIRVEKFDEKTQIREFFDLHQMNMIVKTEPQPNPPLGNAQLACSFLEVSAVLVLILQVIIATLRDGRKLFFVLILQVIIATLRDGRKLFFVFRLQVIIATLRDGRKLFFVFRLQVIIAILRDGRKLFFVLILQVIIATLRDGRKLFFVFRLQVIIATLRDGRKLFFGSAVRRVEGSLNGGSDSVADGVNNAVEEREPERLAPSPDAEVPGAQIEDEVDDTRRPPLPV
ncbi:unnamed protein product [Caenorhabditis brenneri]